MLLLIATGCAEMRESWDTGAEAAANVHRQDARALCASFAPEMLSALPCDAVEEVMARTTAVVGEPTGECRWGYTYRIVALEPLRSVAIHQCPFARETVQVTVAVRADANGGQVTGLWMNSPGLRSTRLVVRFELCENIDEPGNGCVGEISETAWQRDRIHVWNHLQNLRSGDELVWKWFAPDGTQVTELHRSLDETPGFDHRTWSTIEPGRLPDVKDPYGRWRVVLEVNGDELGALAFQVVRATS